TRVGAGTVVSASLPEQLTASPVVKTKPTASDRKPRRVAFRCSQVSALRDLPWMVHRGPFRVGQVAFDQFPWHIWSSLVTRHARTEDEASTHYGDPMGLHSLRRSVANYLKISRSTRCEAEQIFIVSGSQQALEITARVLLNPGDRVWVEEPN